MILYHEKFTSGSQNPANYAECVEGRVPAPNEVVRMTFNAMKGDSIFILAVREVFLDICRQYGAKNGCSVVLGDASTEDTGSNLYNVHMYVKFLKENPYV